VTYRLEWRLVGRENRLLDAGEIDGDLADHASALQTLNAFLLTFAIRGRNDAAGYWWGRRSADADIEVQVVLLQPGMLAPVAAAPRPEPWPARTLARSWCRAPPTNRGSSMTSEERTLLGKAAVDPNGQIALKRNRCGAWHSDRDRLAALTSHGHLSCLGEIMGPHLGGTLAVWQITAVGRALADEAGSAR